MKAFEYLNIKKGRCLICKAIPVLKYNVIDKPFLSYCLCSRHKNLELNYEQLKRLAKLYGS